mgnify:CR=1 FL=1
MKKMLIIAIIAIVAVVCVSSVVSAGLFDFLGSSSSSDQLKGQEVNLAAAASLKNAYETYDSIFAEIKEMQDPKEYVIACLQIHIFEVSNRFHFFANKYEYF